MNSGQATCDPVGVGAAWPIRIGSRDVRGAPARLPRAKRSASLGRRGEPGLHWPAAPRFPPPPVEPAMGGRPLPMCRPGRGSRRTVFVTGARNASGVVGRATSARGRRDNAVGAPGRAKTTGRGPWGGWCTTATTDPSHLPRRPTAGRLVQEGAGCSPEPWDPHTRVPPSTPRASPYERGTRRGATAPGTLTARCVRLAPTALAPPGQRRPLTHGCRTPLQPQPRHRPARYGTTNPL